MSGCVAIITRTKNRTILLERAVESVLKQKYTDWVHVVVNDGGQQKAVDDLLGFYKQHYAGRLRVIHNRESLGMEAASNKGIAASDSVYVTIHDDDDSWEPEFLGTCVSILEKTAFPTVRGVTTHTNQIFEDVNVSGIKEVSRKDFDPFLTSVSLTEITEINKFMPISFVFRRDVFDAIGLFDESLPVVGDWEFNIRFLSKFDVIVEPSRLANYHIRLSADEHYANTVTAEQNKHRFYRDLIVNRCIRKDLEAGRISIGTLMAFGDYFHRTGGNTWRLLQAVERVKSYSPIKLARRALRI